MGGGVLNPDNPYFIPFKLMALLPVILVGMAAAPLVVSGVSASAYRLLNPAATLGGLAQKGFEIRRRGQRLKTGLTVLGLTTGTNIHHDIYPSSSSGGGGPGGIPNLHRPPPSMQETGEILTNPPIVSDSSKPGPARYALPADSAGIGPGKHNPCAKGYSPKKIKGRWYCVKKG